MRNKPERPRVLCIGWHKTGTTTMGTALLTLGYSVLGCRLDTVHLLQDEDIEAALRIADPFDALQDVPWAVLFRELDERYPGSKFILTVRNEATWLKSAQRHFKETPIPLHGWIYGKDRLAGNEAHYLARFRQHYAEVRAYFADRPNDLLEFDISAGDGWEKLCSFLDEPVPASRFPHENQAPASVKGVRKWRRIVRDLLPAHFIRLGFQIKLWYLSALGEPDPRNRFNNFPMNRIEAEKYRRAARRGDTEVPDPGNSTPYE